MIKIYEYVTLLKNYSRTCLSWAPTGPKSYAQHNEVPKLKKIELKHLAQEIIFTQHIQRSTIHIR